MSPKEALQQKLGYSFRNIVADSRLVGPGDLFIALSGERVDGHEFLEEAYAKGCSCALIARPTSVNIPHIIVPDPLAYIQNVVTEYVLRYRPRVIAITGSLGKTTTKEFLHQMMATTYHVAASPGNANSQIGLPLAILNHFSGKEEFWIVEAGMSFAGELTRLAHMVQPEIVLITQISLVHAENFDGLEGIARSKAELFSHPSTSLCMINSHSSCLNILQNVGNCTKVLVDEHEVIERYPNALPGKHLYQNLAMAVEAARYLNVSVEKIDEIVPHLRLEAHRMQFIEKEGVFILNDSYNASELSTIGALDSIPHDVKGEKIVLFGQITELGKFSDETHANIAKHALKCADKMICYGSACAPIFDLWSSAKKPVFWTNDRIELLKHVNETVVPGDFLLLKGSCSNALWELIPKIQIEGASNR